MDELLEIIQQENSHPARPVPLGPIQAILFDAGDVLYHRPQRGCQFKAFLKELGLDQYQPAGADKHALRTALTRA